jgi:hypothetical protein
MLQVPFQLESLPAELLNTESVRKTLSVTQSELNALIAQGRLPRPLWIHGGPFWRP